MSHFKTKMYQILFPASVRLLDEFHTRGIMSRWCTVFQWWTYDCGVEVLLNEIAV